MSVYHRITQQCRSLLYLVQFVIRNFINDDCAYRASALAFVTLLAIVPLTIVGLSVFSSFPVFQNLRDPLQHFIFDNFVPSTGQLIEDYLQVFIDQVAKSSLSGIIFLLFTAILVMFTIERSMNTIWRVTTHRDHLSAFLLYWAILSLAPLLLGLSLAASSYLLSSSIFNQHLPWIFIHGATYLLSFVGFTFLYVVVPNHPVKIRHGAIAALITTLLFETAKLAFAYFLIHYNPYKVIYGAFAIIPIFLIWIFWVWVITLLGAEISYALSVDPKHRQENH